MRLGLGQEDAATEAGGGLERRLSGTVLFVMATASAFAVILSFDGFGAAVRTALLGISSEQWVILLTINLLLLFLSMIMETMAIMVLLVPILAPIVVALGVARLCCASWSPC